MSSPIQPLASVYSVFCRRLLTCAGWWMNEAASVLNVIVVAFYPAWLAQRLFQGTVASRSEMRGQRGHGQVLLSCGNMNGLDLRTLHVARTGNDY